MQFGQTTSSATIDAVPSGSTRAMKPSGTPVAIDVAGSDAVEQLSQIAPARIDERVVGRGRTAGRRRSRGWSRRPRFRGRGAAALRWRSSRSPSRRRAAGRCRSAPRPRRRCAASTRRGGSRSPPRWRPTRRRGRRASPTRPRGVRRRARSPRASRAVWVRASLRPRSRPAGSREQLGGGGLDLRSLEEVGVHAAVEAHRVGEREVAEVVVVEQAVARPARRPPRRSRAMSSTSKWPMSEPNIAFRRAPNGLTSLVERQRVEAVVALAAVEERAARTGS